MSNLKENRFLHSLPGQPGVPAIKPAMPTAIAPRAVPAIPHPAAAPRAHRWNRLQEYLSKAASPMPVPAPKGEEPPEK